MSKYGDAVAAELQAWSALWATAAPAMGGAIRVVDEDEVGNGVANDASGPLFSNRNSVPAVWMSYNRIVCVTPPWDGISDDDKHHGGYQGTCCAFPKS